ncbi:MAG: hypothetical protein ACK4R6_07950 [Spirosomataceae bacterium]
MACILSLFCLLSDLAPFYHFFIEYFIIAGTSNSIERAEHTVFSLSRTSSPKLDIFAERLQHISTDLTETENQPKSKELFEVKLEE